MYSAWKSQNLAIRARAIPTFCSFWAIEITTEFLFAGMAVAGVLPSHLPVVRARSHTSDQGAI